MEVARRGTFFVDQGEKKRNRCIMTSHLIPHHGRLRRRRQVGLGPFEEALNAVSVPLSPLPERPQRVNAAVSCVIHIIITGDLKLLHVCHLHQLYRRQSAV